MERNRDIYLRTSVPVPETATIVYFSLSNGFATTVMRRKTNMWVGFSSRYIMYETKSHILANMSKRSQHLTPPETVLCKLFPNKCEGLFAANLSFVGLRCMFRFVTGIPQSLSPMRNIGQQYPG